MADDLHLIHSFSPQHIQRSLFAAAILLIIGCGSLTAAKAQAKFEPRGDVVYHGAGLPDYWSEDGLRSQVERYRQLSGKNLAILTWFASQYENGQQTAWRQRYATNLKLVQQMGGVSLIKFSTCDSAYANTRKIAAPPEIARGWHDAYFREFADAIKEFGDPVFISINHEMNGNWYPYSQDYSGTKYSAADYVAMWQRIVHIFRQRGVTNVAWVWSPNVPDVGRVPATAYYPGDSYVDWVGPSFYSGSTFEQMDKLYQRYAPRKPFFITEWATSPRQSRYNADFPGDAQWVASFFQALQQRYPRVKAISWFQWHNRDGNFRLERVPDQQRVYLAKVQHPRYSGDAGSIIRSHSGSAPLRQAALPPTSTPARRPHPSTPRPAQRISAQPLLRDRLQLPIGAQGKSAVQR